MNSCAAVRASPLARCGRCTGSPMPAAAVDKSGAVSSATWSRSASAAARSGSQAASMAVSSAGPLRHTPRQFKSGGEEADVHGCGVGHQDATGQRIEDRVERLLQSCRAHARLGRRADDRPSALHRNPGNGADLVVLLVGTGHLESQHGERRVTPGDARAGQGRTQVALHGPGTLFADGHHATRCPELKPRWSLFWIARTSLKASRSWRRLAGSRAFGSR
jgi:hypothetical protein